MLTIDENTFEVDSPVWPDFLNRRNPDSHKGTYGHALLIAGSYGKMGAAVLAARACLRMGVGLLTVHVPRRGVDIMQVAVPEAMVSIDEDEARWHHLFTCEELSRYDAVALGPGLGTESTEALRAIFAACEGLPLVVDADGLNMLSRMDDGKELIQRHAAPIVLTPHAKEFERLFGAFPSEAERLSAQREISRELGCIIVYKGHRSQISDRDGKIYRNTTGNAGLATAGSGDVLTGILLSIMSQNKEYHIDVCMCVCLGVWLHGKSGDFALQKQSECSIVAGDIVKNLKFVTIKETM